jgi:putative phosphoesterase
MKILVLADVHANWQALSAIREPFDACLFLGDAVEYGTEPAPCIDWIRQHATYAIRGNHDHAVVQRVPISHGPGFRRLASATRQQHWKVMKPSHLKYLSRLPVTQYVELGGHSFYLVHATPRDPMDEYLLDDPEGWKQRLKGIDADFVCVGHTHIPLHLDLGRWQLINPGSVGQPRDGDPRAAYAVIENGQVEFRRVAYDIEAAIRQMEQSGLDSDCLELAATVLHHGGKPEDGPLEF